jgi:hypothetical protein
MEGIVAKRRDRPYRSRRSPDWIKVKNPDAPTPTSVIEGDRSAFSVSLVRFIREQWMRRREFIAGLGGSAVWPMVARAQQPARLPTIGFLGPNTPAIGSRRIGAFVH